MCLQRVERNLTTEQQSSLCELSLIMFVCMQGPLPQPSHHSALRTPSHLASSVCVRHSMHCCFLVGGHSIGHWISGLEGQEVISVCFLFHMLE